MYDQVQNDLQQLVQKIQRLLPEIELLKNKCSQKVAQIEAGKQLTDLRASEDYLQARFHLDTMRRISILVEQNFNFIESMGLLAVTRYIFELTVWVKLISNDKRDAQIYHYELIVGQQKYYEDQRKHLEKEIAFLDSYGKLENELLAYALNSATTFDANAGESVMQDIDEEVSRKFSIYGDNARINGYGFQAYLLQTEILPQIQQRIDELKIDMDSYRAETPSSISNRIRKKWNWKEEARKVAMESEYEFIYTYTSKLIHATPSSLSTSMQTLDPTEMRIFLKYIYVRMQDIIRSISKTLA